MDFLWTLYFVFGYLLIGLISTISLWLWAIYSLESQPATLREAIAELKRYPNDFQISEWSTFLVHTTLWIIVFIVVLLYIAYIPIRGILKLFAPLARRGIRGLLIDPILDARLPGRKRKRKPKESSTWPPVPSPGQDLDDYLESNNLEIIEGMFGPDVVEKSASS